MESLEKYEAGARLFREKYSEVGDLGLTAEDHALVSSTPDDLLAENPGKTLGELWSDEQIKQWLDGLKKFTEEDDEDASEHWLNRKREQKENLEASKKYLESIGRLPKGFE
jgi:hypothetical protein